MLVQTTYTQGTTKEHYDRLLSEGWFRGTGVIYKSDIVCMDENIFSTLNIRLPLAGFQFKKRHSKLLRKNKGLFTYTLGPPAIDEEKENLYSQHLYRFKSFVHNSLADLINTGLEDITFETTEICIYKDNKLVALSYFDSSDTSAASILCVYDGKYSAYSLGIFTMLLEIEIAQSRGIQFYYPGYVMDLPSCFDYKLSLGRMEWLDHTGNWTTDCTNIAESTKAALIRKNISQLRNALSKTGIGVSTRIYPYFTVGYVLWYHPDLLKLPVYLKFSIDQKEWGASYDIESESYVLFMMSVAEEFSHNPGLVHSRDYRDGASYEMRLMRCDALWRFESYNALMIALGLAMSGEFEQLNQPEIHH